MDERVNDVRLLEAHFELLRVDVHVAGRGIAGQEENEARVPVRAEHLARGERDRVGDRRVLHGAAVHEEPLALARRERDAGRRHGSRERHPAVRERDREGRHRKAVPEDLAEARGGVGRSRQVEEEALARRGA